MTEIEAYDRIIAELIRRREQRELSLAATRSPRKAAEHQGVITGYQRSIDVVRDMRDRETTTDHFVGHESLLDRDLLAE